MKFIAASLAQFALPAVLLGGCASAGGYDDACNNAAFLAAQHAHVNHAEVTFCGPVVRVKAPKRTRSGVHRYIYIDAGHGDVVEVDANLDEMGNFPVRAGEQAVVRGEYYYDQSGREGVHWTHHTDRGSHPPGYLILDGTTYR